MEEMNATQYTDPEKPMDPKNRAAYNKWERKFNNYDQNVSNWEDNKNIFQHNIDVISSRDVGTTTTNGRMEGYKGVTRFHQSNCCNFDHMP